MRERWQRSYDTIGNRGEITGGGVKVGVEGIGTGGGNGGVGGGDGSD